MFASVLSKRMGMDNFVPYDVMHEGEKPLLEPYLEPVFGITSRILELVLLRVKPVNRFGNFIGNKFNWLRHSIGLT